MYIIRIIKIVTEIACLNEIFGLYLKYCSRILNTYKHEVIIAAANKLKWLTNMMNNHRQRKATVYFAPYFHTHLHKYFVTRLLWERDKTWLTFVKVRFLMPLLCAPHRWLPRWEVCWIDFSRWQRVAKFKQRFFHLVLIIL